MKFICDGLNLSESLLKVSKAVGVKKLSHILEGIKITAKGDILTLVATDGELTISKSMVADVHLEGEIVVPGKYFTDFIKKLEKEQIEITLVEGSRIEIKYGDNVTYLACYDATNYPKIEEDLEQNNFVIMQKTFKDLLLRTVYAVATGDEMPYFKGCLLESEGEDITCVGLDGSRIALTKRKMEKCPAKDFKAVVPGRTLSEIVRLIEKEEEELVVSIRKNSIKVVVGDTTVISKLYQNNFTNYKSIIPTNFNTQFTVNKKAFQNSIERLMLIYGAGEMPLVNAEIKENNLLMKAESEIGKINENLFIEMEGKDLSLGFVGKLIADYMRVCDGENITFYFNNSIMPFIIRADNDQESLYLVLPTRINC